MTPRDAALAATSIEGWMSFPELEWLAWSARSRAHIVEVGSWRGRSTKAIALSTPGTVFAVDHWKGSNDAHPEAYRGALKVHGPEGLYRIFMDNLLDEIASGRCQVLRMDSALAAAEIGRLMGRGSLDMVFIDADHSYEGCRRDIESWRPLLAPGGLLSGHDYEPNWPGVRKAVDELVPGREIVKGTSIWRAP